MPIEAAKLLDYIADTVKPSLLALADKRTTFVENLHRALAYELALAILRESRMRTLAPGVSNRPSDPGNVPVYQFWNDPSPPSDVGDCMASWSAVFGNRIKRFDSASARELVRQTMPTECLEAYDTCHHPAMQCDYFRLVALFSTGGIYIDADERSTGTALRTRTESTTATWLRWLCVNHLTRRGASPSDTRAIIDGTRNAQGFSFYFANAPILCAAKDPIIEIALLRATHNLLDAKRKGELADIHAATGPTNLTVSVFLHFLDALRAGGFFQLEIINDWERYSTTITDLEYRKTPANWRITEGLQRRGPTNEDAETILNRLSDSDVQSPRETVSGPGSTKANTRRIVQVLPILLQRLGVKSVLDLGCGDFNWMVDVDLTGIDYVGVDIADEIIGANGRFASKNINFRKLDMLHDTLPMADVVIIRDCLGHFSYSDISVALANVGRSGSRWLLATTFPGREGNIDIRAGMWRPVNLEAFPFSLPDPELYVFEHCTEGDGRYRDKALGLWLISNLQTRVIAN